MCGGCFGIPHQPGFPVQLLLVDTHLTAQIIKILIGVLIRLAVYRVHQNIPDARYDKFVSLSRSDIIGDETFIHLGQRPAFHKIRKYVPGNPDLLRVLRKAVHGLFLEGTDLLLQFHGRISERRIAAKPPPAPCKHDHVIFHALRDLLPLHLGKHA